MSDLRRLKVAFSGPAHGKYIEVTDALTGEPFPVVSVDFHADIHGVPRLTVTTHYTDADIEADARVIRLCPACKREREREVEAEEQAERNP